jgi:hypothetical protein
MAQAHAARQFSLRLPGWLAERVERCTDEMREAGLDVTRADVVRLPRRHALDATHCKVLLLFGRSARQKRARK